MSNEPIRVAVTGAAGNIGYQLLFRIASGSMLGPDQPVVLQMLEIPPAMDALTGVRMELSDGAFPLVDDMITGDDPNEVFADADIAMLVGARPRGEGMERADLLEANGAIFTAQGKALNDVASKDVKVIVVGNPANTNALIAMSNAPDIPDANFTGMTRLDHNRALAQLAGKADVEVEDIKQMIIWGNHSATQYPDYHHVTIEGKPMSEFIDDEKWLNEHFIPKVQKRGAQIISVRGASSAASAASAAVDHVRDWMLGTPDDDWTSMAVPSDGSYGVPEGLISSFPVRTQNGNWEIVQGLEINEASQKRLDATVAELSDERDTVRELGLI